MKCRFRVAGGGWGGRSAPPSSTPDPKVRKQTNGKAETKSERRTAAKAEKQQKQRAERQKHKKQKTAEAEKQQKQKSNKSSRSRKAKAEKQQKQKSSRSRNAAKADSKKQLKKIKEKKRPSISFLLPFILVDFASSRLRGHKYPCGRHPLTPVDWKKKIQIQRHLQLQRFRLLALGWG